MRLHSFSRLAGLCTAITLISFAQANILPVSNTNDSGPGSLRAVIAQGNAIDPSEPVTIDVGILFQFTSEGSPVIELANLISITRPMDIINNTSSLPVTLRMVGSSRHFIFNISTSGSSTLSGLRFENGKQPATTGRTGGAIFYSNNNNAVAFTLAIENCSFVNNTAGESGSATGNDGVGGAIFFVNSSTTITPSLVVKNTVFDSNRALSSNAAAINRAARGAAIFTRRANVTIKDSVFTQHLTEAGSADYPGGAVAIESPPSTAHIRRSTFAYNEGTSGASVLWLGAINQPLSPAANVEVSDSVFHHNSLASVGPAIVGGGRAGAGSSLLLRNTTLAHNSGAEVSAVRTQLGFGALALEHCTVTRNHATTGNGTAVRVFTSGSSLSLSRSVVAGNTHPAAGSVTSPDILLLSSVGVFPGFNSAGYNVVGSASGNSAGNSTLLSGELNQPGDTFGTNASPLDPGLAELADYGGPTLTAPPHPTGPLVDAIPGNANLLAADQRATTRPQGTASDIGAVELPRVPFTTWNLQIADAGQRTATDDPDGDGMSNGLEYYLGTAPASPSLTPVRMISDETGDYLEVIRSATVRPAFFSLERVETSPSLTDPVWSPVTIRPVVTPENPGSLDRVRFRYPLALGGEPARFYRVRAE